MEVLVKAVDETIGYWGDRSTRKVDDALPAVCDLLDAPEDAPEPPDSEQRTADAIGAAVEAVMRAEREGVLELRRECGARDDETFPAFVRRLAHEAKSGQAAPEESPRVDVKGPVTAEEVAVLLSDDSDRGTRRERYITRVAAAIAALVAERWAGRERAMEALQLQRYQAQEKRWAETCREVEQDGRKLETETT